jgi:transposase
VDEIEDAGIPFERVAAIDIGKAEMTVCVRTPMKPGGQRRKGVVRKYRTFTSDLLEMSDWLRCEQVQVVGMEATSDYWKPVFYLLEAEGHECWLLNAKHVKHVPGRPKTDRLDAVWLAKVLERGMCSPSLVQPKPIRELRDLTRYRRSQCREATREKQRVEKLLEDAGIKLSVVASDIFGVSGRAMMEAMIAGERDPRVLAQMARGVLRRKHEDLVEALTGFFEDHHAFLLRRMLDHLDALEADVAALDARIEKAIAPFADRVAQLDDIPGVGVIAARELIAEIGVDMSRFPTAGHLASWAKFAPIDHRSAGRGGANTTGKGNPWLAAALGEVVASLAGSDTFLGARYRRLRHNRGKLRAIVATGNSVLQVVYELLRADPEVRFEDRGPHYYESRIDKQRRQRSLIRQLEQLTGKKVDLHPAA